LIEITDSKNSPRWSFYGHQNGTFHFKCSQDIINKFDKQLEGEIYVHFVKAAKSDEELISSGSIKINVEQD